MPPAPAERPSRRTDRLFPPYRFVPGENPHPYEHPDGYAYGHSADPMQALTVDNWSSHTDYLFGVDLYNEAYWWGSHEAWEGLWRLSGREDRTGRFLQGLIKISAAFLKWHLRQERGVASSYAGGVSLLKGVAADAPRYMGLDIPEHLARLEKHFKPVLATPLAHWPDPLTEYPFLTLDVQETQ